MNSDETEVPNTVIEHIAELAASQVPGVHRVVHVDAPPPMSALAQDIFAVIQEGRGVKATRHDGRVRLEIRVIIELGSGVGEVARAVRRAVTARVEEMADVSVSSVRVRVIDVRPPPAAGGTDVTTSP